MHWLHGTEINQQYGFVLHLNTCSDFLNTKSPEFLRINKAEISHHLEKCCSDMVAPFSHDFKFLLQQPETQTQVRATCKSPQVNPDNLRGSSRRTQLTMKNNELSLMLLQFNVLL